MAAGIVASLPPGFTLDEDPDASALPPGFTLDAPEPKAAESKASLKDEVSHILGLTGRAMVKGVTGLPEIVGNAANAATNYGIRGVNAVAGSHIPQLGTVSAGVDNLLDQAGFSRPRNKVEEGVQVMGSALAGAGGFNALQNGVQAVSRASGTLADGVLNELARAPVLQTIGAGTGYLASDAAREAGVKNPYALMLLGTLGGVAGGSGATLAGRAAGGAAQLAAPFRSASGPGIGSSYSREGIIGNVLNKLATTPGITPSVLESAQPLVPGSNPTIAQASRDPGLIAAEVGIRNALDSGGGSSGRIAQRYSQQNTARNEALDRLEMPSVAVPEGAQPPRGSLQYAQAKRQMAVDEDLTQAMSNPNRGVADTEPVMDTINRVLSRPTGAKADVQNAMEYAYNRLNQERVDLTDPETLYAIRQDLKDAANGHYNTDKPALARARSQLNEVIGSLDDAIDTAAPGYRDYLDLYAKRSRPLNQQTALRDLRQRGELAGSDPISGDRILSIGKYGTAVRKAIASGKLGTGVGNANLSPQQMSTIHNVVDDLDRGAATTAGTIRPAGSDTFRNLSIASVIGRVLGDNVPKGAVGQGMQTVMKPLSWMYGMQDEALQQMLVDAVLDPQLAARFMRTANRQNVENLAAELAKRAGKQAQGNAIYGANSP